MQEVEENLETQEIEENLEIQVEILEKKKTKKTKFTETKMFDFVKILLGIYMIGVIVGLNEYIMTLYEPVINFVYDSTFMTAIFTPVADIILGPARFMARLLTWFTPVVLITTLYFFVLSKIKWIKKAEWKMYLFITIITLIVVI